MLWKQPTATPETVTAPSQVRCPDCQSIEAVPVVNIKSYAISATTGEVIESVIGYRIACQRCPRIYSVTGTGVFQHHRQSAPIVEPPRPEPIERDAPLDPRPLHHQPKPRARPGV